MCETASFVSKGMSSPTTLVQQAEASGRNEKNLHKRSAEAFFRDGHTLGACYKQISLDSTFLIYQNPFRIYTFIFMLKPCSVTLYPLKTYYILVFRNGSVTNRCYAKGI